MANLAESQPDREKSKNVVGVARAFDAEGKPSKAAEGWARGCGITVDRAERSEDRQRRMAAVSRPHGAKVPALVPVWPATSLAKTTDPETDALGRV